MVNSLVSESNPIHQAAMEDLTDWIRKYASRIPPDEMLVLAAKHIGRIMACQDTAALPVERQAQIIAKHMKEAHDQILGLSMTTLGSA